GAAPSGRECHAPAPTRSPPPSRASPLHEKPRPAPLSFHRHTSSTAVRPAVRRFASIRDRWSAPGQKSRSVRPVPRRLPPGGYDASVPRKAPGSRLRRCGHASAHGAYAWNVSVVGWVKVVGEDLVAVVRRCALHIARLVLDEAADDVVAPLRAIVPKLLQ